MNESPESKPSHAPTHPLPFNYRKVIENTVTLLVTSVFVGACAIVWNGATTVNEKVGLTEKNLQVLINNLSEQLSKYEAQLIVQSNQLAEMSAEIKQYHTNGAVPTARPNEFIPNQQSIQSDIYRNLNKK